MRGGLRKEEQYKSFFPGECQSGDVACWRSAFISLAEGFLVGVTAQSSSISTPSTPSPVTGWRGRRREKRAAAQATLSNVAARAHFSIWPPKPKPPMTPDASPPTAVNQLPRCALTQADPDPHPNQPIPLPAATVWLWEQGSG
jgi:hypothetical protein